MKNIALSDLECLTLSFIVITVLCTGVAQESDYRVFKVAQIILCFISVLLATATLFKIVKRKRFEKV